MFLKNVAFTTNASTEKSATVKFATMEEVIRETREVSLIPCVSRTSPVGPMNLKRKSALTVRPTIGEERKAWLLEAQRAYCLNELQNHRVPESFRRTTASTRSLQPTPATANRPKEATSASCPELEVRCELEPVHQKPSSYKYECNSARSSVENLDSVNMNSSAGSVDEKDSCEFLFQHVEGCFKPSKIRLSPRMEKLGNDH